MYIYMYVYTHVTYIIIYYVSKFCYGTETEAGKLKNTTCNLLSPTQHLPPT